ncbi:MAG: A24 family peptidase [Rhodoferax sp.]|nr:A24 family peptidase [Rhodoferax sp.]
MQLTPWFDATIFAVLGLLIGSFLNVVIYRLPLMLEAQWKAEYAELSGTEMAPVEKFNLALPGSKCPKCGHQIRWFENIPVLSYLFLRGKCSGCTTPISLRYPLVELTTGALFFYCAWKWGISPAAVIWSGFAASLLAMALIDWDTTLLPDDMTLPLLWAGLIAAALQWTPAGLSAAVWGAVAGYLSLWLVYWAFKLITGKEGMGFGDFKLFAALGAWFGWQALVPIILMASVIGAVVGIAMKFSSGLRPGGYVPFGPFLAGAGLTAMIFGPDSILRFIGL